MSSLNCRLVLRNCQLIGCSMAPNAGLRRCLSSLATRNNVHGHTNSQDNSNATTRIRPRKHTTTTAASSLLVNQQQQQQQQPYLTTRRHLGTAVPRPYVDPKLSYAFGRSNEQLVYSTVSRELDDRFRDHPDELAYISHSEKLKVTFRQLEMDVNRLAKSMVTKFGIEKGDFVGVFAYNCYHWIVVQMACSRVGAILSPVNPSYKSHELAHVLKKGKIKCLFTMGPKSIQAQLNNHLDILQADQIVEMSKKRGGELCLEHVILMDAENEYGGQDGLVARGLRLAKCGLHDWTATTNNDGQVFKSAQEAEAAGVDEHQACILDLDAVSPDDLFAVYYTSGTTGLPKGACLSQFTVVNNVKLCQVRLRNGRPRNWKAMSATTLPMFHIFAGVLNTLSPCVSNTTVIYSGHKYDIPTFVESILEHGANITTVTPTMLIDMLAYIEQKKITNVPLKLIQPGGAFLPPELVSRTFKLLPDLEELRTGYGSSENGAVATFQTIHEPHEFRANTVGPPIDFTEIRVVQPGSERLAPLGAPGEIQTRGHNTLVEYLDEPEKTAEVVTANKWYRTGDIGIMHAHGSIEICGRIKNMIIKGGENIYPDEVQQMIHKMDCVENVHVVGVPDDRFGEQVCAWVKLKPGFVAANSNGKENTENTNTKVISAQDIIEFSKANITYFKVPKYVLFVDDFPMTPTKKVQGHIMTERSIEMLGLKKKSSDKK